VTLDFNARLATLARLVAALDGSALTEATDQLLRRLAYVDFFAVVLDTVPAAIPHENGALWWDAVSRPFMPRLLFPDKAIIDDSERTNIYTGLGVAGSDRGVSFSIGYMGESYIDFGRYGMMLPVFGFGLMLGGIYRWLMLQRHAPRLLGMALATAILYGAVFLESSITKVFGGLAVTILVSWLIVRVAAPLILPAQVAEAR
jgi:hypothetical protein